MAVSDLSEEERAPFLCEVVGMVDSHKWCTNSCCPLTSVPLARDCEYETIKSYTLVPQS